MMSFCFVKASPSSLSSFWRLRIPSLPLLSLFQAGRIVTRLCQTHFKSSCRETTLTSQTRLNKYLSEIGYCSRRAADRLIGQGRVTINGQLAELGSKVTVIKSNKTELLSNPDSPAQVDAKWCGSCEEIVKINNKEISVTKKRNIYLALNKPVGVVCTADSARERNNIIDFLQYPSEERLFYVGRLDKPSSGLILLTNDGEIVNNILKAKHQHEKEYIVEVDKSLNKEVLHGMSEGVPILDGTVTTRSCCISQINDTKFRITLTQGLNRQIRRMCEHFGYKVESLKRVRIMNITLGSLKVGEYRELAPQEIKDLFKQFKC